MSTSDLIDDVGALPAIIGDMGLAIAQAQTLLDSNYLHGLERVAALAKSLLGDAGTSDQAAAARETAAAMLRALAPARYRYTETTLSVRLDMARSVQAAGSVGVGASFGAVVVNASLMLGFAYDYRGAAEIRTVIHADTSGEAFDKLLARAAALNDKALELPPQSKVDQAVMDKAVAIFTKIAGAAPAKQITGSDGTTPAGV
jgi:hypothetical protein